ncbi:SRPBCC family protein [Saprospiraceae bacterium]|nr:SRPBCC family protein [Saprospiraceae bacterium]
MKFRCQVDIDLPRDLVVEAFDSPENLKEWQDGFVSYEHKSGASGEVGAQAIMVYKIGKRDMVLTETILKNDLPRTFIGQYDFKEGSNTMSNTFEIITVGITRWVAEVEYTRMDSFMMKMMSKLMPGMFKKQTQKWLNQFKVFVEKKN